MNRKIGVSGLVVTTVILSVDGSLWAAGHLVPSMTGSVGTIWFADGTPAGGRSTLTRTDGMVVAVLEAENLIPGDAYTMWWVVFNNPAGCTDGVCGEDDIFNEDGTPNFVNIGVAGVGVGNASGNVAKSDGTAEFGGRLAQNDNSGAHQIVIPAAGVGDVLLTASPHDAEVHLVIQTHGQGRGGSQLQEQLTYLRANCTPNCEDIQAAVHLP